MENRHGIEQIYMHLIKMVSRQNVSNANGVTLCSRMDPLKQIIVCHRSFECGQFKYIMHIKYIIQEIFQKLILGGISFYEVCVGDIFVYCLSNVAMFLLTGQAGTWLVSNLTPLL